jgi:DNA-binding CsgD family transcriptional regulator/tetratricopeptide (TPR) repeat protein
MARNDAGGLTPRERDVAAAYASGASAPQIAERFGIAPSTVKSHLAAIYGKLGVTRKIDFLRALPFVVLDEGGAPVVAVPRPHDPAASIEATRLGDLVAQCLAAELAGSAELRLVTGRPALRSPARGDCVAVAREVGARYLAVPETAVCAEGALLLLKLLDASGEVCSVLRRTLPMPCPLHLAAEAAEAFAAAIAGPRGELGRLERMRRFGDVRGPDDAHRLYLAAGDLLEVGTSADADTAVALSLRAVALDPRHPRAWMMLNWCRHWRASHGWGPIDPTDRETSVFRRAAELAPRDGLPLAYLALARAKAGARSEAERILGRAVDLAARDPATMAEVATGVVCVAGQPGPGLRLVEAALDRCDASPPAWRYMEARAALFSGLPERALMASDLAPECLPNLVVRSLAAVEVGDAAEARRSWSRLVALAPAFDFATYALQVPISHPCVRARYDAAAHRLTTLLAA